MSWNDAAPRTNNSQFVPILHVSKTSCDQAWWRQINKFHVDVNASVIFADAAKPPESFVSYGLIIPNLQINSYDLDKGEKDGIFSVTSIASLIKDENAKPNVPGGLGGTGKFEIPDDRDLISRYLARTLIQEMKGVLFINTFKVAVIVIQLSNEADYHEVLDNVEAAIDREARYSDMMVTGLVAMQQAVQKESMQSLLIIFPISII